VPRWRQLDPVVEIVLQELLETEITAALGVAFTRGRI
jgi:hypothetical protein